MNTAEPVHTALRSEASRAEAGRLLQIKDHQTSGTSAAYSSHTVSFQLAGQGSNQVSYLVLLRGASLV